MKVYVVSLERAAERRTFMQQQLDKYKLDYEIIDAVDYKKLTDDDFRTLTDVAAVAANQYLTPGAQACALSHVKVCNKIVADNNPLALVLEDDAIIPDNIQTILAAIEKAIGHDEIISLSYYHRFEKNTYLSDHNRTPLYPGNELVFPVNLHHTGSTMAYVITKDVAKKLAEVMMPISVIADWWGEYYDKGAFRSFRCVYPFQLKPASFSSTLDYVDSGSVKTHVAQLVRKYKIPPFYKILQKKDEQFLKEKYNIHLIDALPFNQQTA